MTNDLLSAAKRDVERARGGEDVTAALLGHASALAALPWSDERYAVERVVRLALLGGSTLSGVRHVLSGAMPLGDRAEVIGLLLRDGDPLSAPLPDNPWAVGASEPLERAIERIWRPVDQPDFVAALAKRTLGLALLRRPGGELALGYMLYHERDRYEVPAEMLDVPRPAFDRRAALAWEPFGDVSLMIGEAPQAGAAELRAGVSIPESLSELYRVHAGMRGGMWWLYEPKGLLLWSEMLGHAEPELVNTEDEDEERMSNELLAFFCYGDDRTDVFDLAADADDPPVRAWGDGMLYQSEGEGFWDWFDGNTALFVRRPET